MEMRFFSWSIFNVLYELWHALFYEEKNSKKKHTCCSIESIWKQHVSVKIAVSQLKFKADQKNLQSAQKMLDNLRDQDK